MPPRSKAQAHLLGMVAAGKKTLPGLTQAQAKEYLKGHSQKGLPGHKRKRKKP